MKVIRCEQGDSIWLANRCGLVTASRISDVMSFNQPSTVAEETAGIGKESAKRKHYRSELVGERITKDTADHFMSWYMREGKEKEPDARLAYGMKHRVMVEEIGLAIHPSMDFSAASPDGLIGYSGGLEIKCPKTTTQVEYLKAKVIPPDYEFQMIWNMVCCEREWWDFWSWHPKLPELEIRLYRDEKRIAEIDAEVRRFNNEIEAEIEALTNPKSLTDQLKASLQEYAR